jgi:hypothetical protein
MTTRARTPVLAAAAAAQARVIDEDILVAAADEAAAAADDADDARDPVVEVGTQSTDAADDADAAAAAGADVEADVDDAPSEAVFIEADDGSSVLDARESESVRSAQVCDTWPPASAAVFSACSCQGAPRGVCCARAASCHTTPQHSTAQHTPARLVPAHTALNHTHACTRAQAALKWPLPSKDEAFAAKQAQVGALVETRRECWPGVRRRFPSCKPRRTRHALAALHGNEAPESARALLSSAAWHATPHARDTRDTLHARRPSSPRPLCPPRTRPSSTPTLRPTTA